MANNIALTVPNLTTPGPAYATQISNDLTTISTHNHDGVNNGTTIDLSAQECTKDLSLQHHNLSNVRSVEFDNEPAKLTGSQDVLCLYVNQGNLGFNTSDGTFVPITQGDALAPSALNNFVNWTMRNGGTPITSNASILPTDTYNLIALNSAGGSFTVTLPVASTIVPSSVRNGRLYVFRDVNNACSTHPVTIQVTPASGNTFGDDGSTSFVLNTNGAYVAIYTDGVGTWFVWAQNAYQGEQLGLNGTVIQAKNGSGLNVDATSQITNSGQYGQNGGIFGLLGSSNLIQGGTLAIDASAAATWSGGATETFATGTSETFQSGASLTCASGSTTTINGTLGIGGTTTISGGTTVTGTTNITGPTTVNVSGLSVTGTATSSVALSKASSFSDSGRAVLCGIELHVATAVAGTPYTCDLGAALDCFIDIVVASAQTYIINLPNPVNPGRIITVSTLNSPVGLTGYSITIKGAGNFILSSLSDFVFPAATGGTVANSYQGVTLIFVGGSVGWAIQNIYGM